MKGAIVGDIAGSRFEGATGVPADFDLFAPASVFTDDTVCTVAVADALLRGQEFGVAFRRWGRRYPNAGYGGMFMRWLHDESMGAYGSWGNGAPMRVSPCAWAAAGLEEALEAARASARPTHGHADAVRAAEAVTLAIWRLRHGAAAAEVRREVEDFAGYELDRSPEGGGFDITARGTTLSAMAVALAAEDFEGAVRSAVSLGGDTDTLACITGAIAEARFGVPEPIWREAERRLTDEIRGVVAAFQSIL